MATCTYVSGATASTATWTGGVPGVNDDAVINTTANAISWDIPSVKSLTLSTGYTGTLTFAATNISFGSGGFTMTAVCTVTGNTSYVVNCGGPFSHSTGTITQYTVTLALTADVTVNTTASFYGVNVGNHKVIWANSTYTRQLGLTVSGGQLYINAGQIFRLYTEGVSVSKINGTVAGPGQLMFVAYAAINLADLSQAIITAPLVITLLSGAPATCAVTATSVVNASGGLTVSSLDGSKVLTLDLNGYNVNANGITVLVRGVLLGKTGTINNSGNLDSSAGTFTPATSTYVQSSTTATIKLAAGGTLYNLIAKTSVITLGANMTITKLYAHINPMVKGAYTLTLTDPTKEYTGMRRPIRKPIQKLNIGQTCAQCGWMQDLGALL